MSQREALPKAGAVSLLGSAFAAVVALVVTAIVSRSLGTADTGLFFQAIALFTVASEVLKLGTGSGIVNSLAEQSAFGRVGQQTRTLVHALVPVLVLSLAVTSLAVALAGPIAEAVGSPEASDQLAALIGLLAPFLVVSASLGVLQSHLRMVRGILPFTLLQSVGLPLTRLILVAAAAVALGAELTGTTLAWAVPLPIWLVVTLALLVRPVAADLRQRSGRRGHWAEDSRAFWAFSAARAVGGAEEVALQWADVLIVGALASPAEAGVYAVATRAVRAGQVVDRAARIAASPTIAALLSRGERSQASALHRSAARALILGTWPYYLLLILMGPAVMGVFGSGFQQGAPVLVVLSLVMMIAAAAGMLQSILIQGGRPSWQMWNKALALALSVGLNIVLVPRLGIMGAALTWAVVVLVDTLIAGVQVHRSLGVRLQLGALMPAMAPPLLVFGLGGLAVRLSLGATPLGLAVLLVVGGGVYLVALWVLRDRLGIQPVWALLSRRWASRASIA